MRIISILVLISMFTSISSCNQSKSISKIKYNRDALECPSEDETNRYLKVPLFHNFKDLNAKTENIPGLNTFKDKQIAYNGKKINLYFELAQAYDSKKPLFVFLNGGPGGDHRILHYLKNIFPKIFNDYNVFTMDHRGLGCSKSIFPGDEPDQALMMRQAASDIEKIRINLAGEGGEIVVWGGSYGTMIGQTYALLYPDHISHLILAGAFSEANAVNEGQARYENFATSSVPGLSAKYYSLKNDYPELAKLFLSWTTGPMYNYTGRTKTIPDMFEKIYDLVKNEKIDEVKKLLINTDITPLPRMTRAIACMEIFQYEPVFENEFLMFPEFEWCKEYQGITDYFNYTDSLKNLNMRTLLISGFYDHVTPFESMKVMANELPNEFFFVDPHMGHSATTGKPDCQNLLFEKFLNNGSNDELKRITLKPVCQKPPETY